LQILWRLDNKEAVDISSIPNENLRKLLECIFDCLKLLRVKEVTSHLPLSAPLHCRPPTWYDGLTWQAVFQQDKQLQQPYHEPGGLREEGMAAICI